MRSVAAVSAACLVCALGAGSARQEPQRPAPVFRTSVKLVVVDVSVLDENRVPVRGLTADDFTILEDGQPQRVATFDAVDVPDVEETAAAWTREVTPDVQRNDAQAGRLMVIVLDDAVPMQPEDVLRVRTLGRSVVERLGPGDLAAVVYTLNQKNGQEFTNDRGRLLAAISKFNGGLVADNTVNLDTFDKKINGGLTTDNPANWETFDASTLTMYRASLGTLQGVAETLISLPQRRKALVYISVGMPMDVEKVEQYIPSVGTIHVADALRDLALQLLDVFRAAGRANVNIYGLDPGGLRVGKTGETVGRLNRDFLWSVSANTGGIAIVDTSDARPGITQIFRENGSYYLLGYEAPSPQPQGQTRRIEIRVNRPGATVRARREYLEPGAAEMKSRRKAAVSPAPDLGAIASVVPKADIFLQATAVPLAGTKQGRASVAVAVRLRIPRPPITEQAADEISVQMNAYNTSGKSAGADAATVHLTLKPGATGDVSYEVLGRLDLAPGRYQLRATAASSLQGKSGSVHLDLDVPDYSKDPLALSGAILGVTPGFASGPRERLAELLPVVPTTQREFRPEDQAVAFIRVYQGGNEPIFPVVVQARIVNSQGAEVFTQSETLEASRFGSLRAADYRLALPLSSLEEGAHLLSIDAARSPGSAAPGRSEPAQTTHRDVRFAVRR